jgi:TPP-dependent trihydroxycyclohexane-1,2-dione (THcHDO) dehydratase
MATQRLTMAQALIKYLSQYVTRDGNENPFFAGHGASSVMGTWQGLGRHSNNITAESVTTNRAMSKHKSMGLRSPMPR